MKLPILLSLFLFQAQSRSTLGTIEGTILRAGSLQPVSNARVAIWGDRGPDFETKTDTNGHYVFSEVPSGIYNIEVQAEGYLPVPNPFSSDRIRLTVDNRQRVRRDIALPTPSTISGRILDRNRDPVAGITVQILTLAKNLVGRSEWRVVESAITDIIGEYRVEGLPADEYYVRAVRKASAVPSVLVNTDDIIMNYFPGTLDARTAATVHLRDGEEQRADFSLATARTYTVSGSVTNSDSPALPSVRLYAIPQDSQIPLDSLVTAGIPADGPFHLKGLLPGPYDLFAVAFAPMRVAKASIEIRDTDVTDVRLILDLPVEIKGRIRIREGNAQSVVLDSKQGPLAPINLTTGLTTIKIDLSLIRNQDFVDGFVIPRLERVSGDSFLFSDVPAGVYDLSIRELGSDKMYVADVREGGRSVFDEGLEIAKRPIDSLEVFVGFDGGGVEGAIVSTRKSPVLVVLAPPPSRRKNRALYKTATLTDASERFRFSNVAPGLYSLFAFELGAGKVSVPYLNPDYLALHAQQAVSVIAESGTVVVSGPLSLITP